MKALLIAILTLVTTFTFAQQPVTWKGGTPGNETSWNEARNWSNNRVPDENTHVVIKQINSGHNAQPTIDTEVTVASIEVQDGSTLTIEKTGELLIDGGFNYSEGITLYNGEVINKGAIYFYNLAVEVSDDYLKKIQNKGFVFVDNQLIDHKQTKVQLVQGN